MSARKFGPKADDHPSVGTPCPVCGVPFVVGDFTTLVATGPADDEEAEKQRAGGYYTAVASEVHWECARGSLEARSAASASLDGEQDGKAAPGDAERVSAGLGGGEC